MNFKTARRIRHIAGIVLIIIVAVSNLITPAVCGEKSSRNVRIGWYESPFNTTDDNGRRSGYAYEYQLKLASYAGWNFTYVNGSWQNLLEMLKDGKIDLMSDVSYTEERAKDMLYSSDG